MREAAEVLLTINHAPRIWWAEMVAVNQSRNAAR
jgi:hypothetical protein